MSNQDPQSENFDLYVRMGFCEIFIINQSVHEAAEHIDYSDETVVAQTSEGYVLVEVSTKRNYYSRSGPETDCKKEIISKEKYEELSRTPSAQYLSGSNLENIKKILSNKSRRAELAAEIARQAPKCPLCSTQMTEQPGKSSPFWGCPRFRSCGSKGLSMSPDVKKKIRERNSLGLP